MKKNKRTITLWIDEKVYHAFKIFCAEKDRTIRSIIEPLIINIIRSGKCIQDSKKG